MSPVPGSVAFAFGHVTTEVEELRALLAELLAMCEAEKERRNIKRKIHPEEDVEKIPLLWLPWLAGSNSLFAQLLVNEQKDQKLGGPGLGG